MLRANYGGLPMQHRSVEPTATDYDQLRADVQANRGSIGNLPMQHGSIRGPATEIEVNQTPPTIGPNATILKPGSAPCPAGFRLTEFGCATDAKSGAGFYNSVAACPEGTTRSSDGLCYLNKAGTPTPTTRKDGSPTARTTWSRTGATPPARGADLPPPPGVDPRVSTEDNPPMRACPDGTMVPVMNACPNPASMPAWRSFWQKYKTAIFVGGGLLGSVTLIALIANSRRSHRSMPSHP